MNPLIDSQTNPVTSSSAAPTGPEDARLLLLIVEDDNDMAELLSYVLQPFYRIETARNGIEGLEKALELHPDLILSDLEMPQMSGPDMVSELRKRDDLAAVPIVVLTATRDANVRVALLHAGAQDYVTKPFTPDELIARIAHQLDVSRAQATLNSATDNRSEKSAPPQELAKLASQVVARQRGLETSLEVLRQSRELFHALARDFAHAPGLYFDYELRFTAEQGEGLMLLGHNPGSLLHKQPSEVFSAEFATLLEPHFHAALRGHSTTFEVPMPTAETANGHEENRILLMRALPVRDETNSITGGLVVAQDLHSHRLEEDEWQGFQARILAQVEDAVNVIDPQRRVIYWNNAAARLYGAEAHDVLGRPLAEIYEYEWLNQGGRATVLRELERNGYWKGECLHRLVKDGREVLVEASISSLRAPGGAHSGFLAVIRDVTARKKTEETRALLEAERDELLGRLQREVEETRHLQGRLNLQFERMPIGCIVWDSEFRVESWNPAATTIFGYTAAEVKGQHAFKSIVPPEVQPLVDEIWQRLSSGDNSAHIVNENVTRDGRRIVCLWSNTPLFERDGTFSGVLSMAQDITDRMQAEESLRLSEERFRSTFEQAGVGVAHISSDGRWLRVNYKLCEILGYTRDEMLSGMHFQDITHPEDLDRNISLFEKALTAPLNSYSMEKRYLHKSGRVVWANLTASLVESPSNESASEPYFIAVIEDITARKRAERNQRLLAEASAAFASSLDYEGTLRTLSRLCVAELAEICVIDLVGRGITVEWPEGAEDNVRRFVAHHRDESQQALLEPLLLYRPRLDAGVPGGDAFSSGRTVHIENFDVNMFLSGIEDADHLALIQSLNIKSCLIVPLIARSLVVGLVKLCSISQPFFERHDIGLIEELMRRAALALENAHLYGEAQQARREAEAASRAKDEFLAVVSHELRTPLTPILGWVSTLRDNEMAGSLDAEMRLHALDAIQQGAEVQSQIIDDLLDVSRIISGNAHLHTHQIRLRTILEAAISVVRPAANKKEIQFWTSFDPALGLIEGDPRRLQQVIGNLLSNAVKFTPFGGRIEIQLSERNGMAQIVVKDTGIGIEPDFLPHVFDRFSQADASTSRLHGGLGLGLSIVRHLVELHNGKVEAHSDGANKGATFAISLPLLPPENLDSGNLTPHLDSIPASPLPQDWAPNSSGPARVSVASDALLGLSLLVVDDEPATRDMLSHILLIAGADVEVADSAMAARQILARWKPDVLISDIGMPGEDGYALIKFVRALHPDEISTVPAIALTAYARGQDRETALKAGYQMHLVKPIPPADLVDAILQLTTKS